jgi:glycosyltransferase involved in cell wall biosynthesis
MLAGVQQDLAPLRLLHVVPTYLPATRYGGPIYSVHGLCKALAARGHEVQVFTTNVDGPGNTDVPLGQPVDLEGVRVRYYPCRHLRRLYWSLPMGRALAAEVGRFDLVHLHSVFLWPTWAAARAARARGVPYVLSPRGMLVGDLIRRKSRWLKTAWIGLIEQRNLEGAAAVHVTSEIEAVEILRFGFRLPSVWEVPNGVEAPAPWSPDGLSLAVARVVSGPPFLLMLGRVSWKKGIDRALRALARVPGAHLVIAGNDDEDYTPKLQALAAELGVAERVRFVGPVVGADKEALLGRASLLLLPSYSENFGNVVLEALARGCPAVVTPVVGAAEVGGAAGGGVVVAGEPEVLAGAVCALLENPERAEMGRRGQQYVAARFTWAAIAERMEAAYRGLGQVA